MNIISAFSKITKDEFGVICERMGWTDRLHTYYYAVKGNIDGKAFIRFTHNNGIVNVISVDNRHKRYQPDAEKLMNEILKLKEE